MPCPVLEARTYRPGSHKRARVKQTPEECAYIDRTEGPKRSQPDGLGDIAGMAKALIKPLSKDLVHAALSNLNATSSLGFEGIPCAVYTAFAGAFVRVMFDIFFQFLRQ